MEADGVEITMGANQQFKFVVLEEYRNGRKSRKEAALLLNKSERTIDRMLKKIAENGISALKHGNHKRTPKNKTPDEIREKIYS
jgi:transposase